MTNRTTKPPIKTVARPILIIAAACLAFCLQGCASGSGEPGPDSFGIVNAEFVKANIDEVPVVDVRMPQEYKEGHIPGSINIVYSSSPCTAEHASANMASAFEDVGILPEDEVILYCKTGVRAKAVAELLAQKDYTNIKVYEGSWTDWTSNPENPIEQE